ncbi:serine/threonine protein kinase [Archangium lipolyticum]|uniref:serine/threonine protein kinase n=1 Tax=Archangium lipolyticum TaxID=2970465 RepID=UPI00214A1D8D|nr:serine/threonine-protein kinase [Archangium lipolyticum]
MVIHLPKDGARVGDYTIRHKLGEGGSGYVYKAERGGRYFAIKFLSELEWTGWNRREVTIMVRLQTLNLQIPNVVGFRGCERWPDPDIGYPYIVMDFVPGLTMDKYVQKFNPSPRVALGKFLKIAKAMGEVHRLDVLHRDLKELNIIIRADDGEPVVIDFGYGAMKGIQTETGPGRVPPGTPEYRSPEIIKFLRGETPEDIYTYTVSDELWAMGVILYWLLTDVMPFGGRLESGLNDRIRLNTPRAPHLINPRVPESASRLCMRMLEKDPQARFKGDDELCAALEAVLSAAEGDASWDLPLIDPLSPHDATTAGNASADEEPNGRAKEVQQWIAAHKPRRGWWPVEEPPAQEQEAPPPPSPDELPSPRAKPEAPAAGPVADGAAPGGARGVRRWLGASGPLPMGALMVDMLKRPPLALVAGLAVVALAVGSLGPLQKPAPAPSVAPASMAQKAAPPPSASASGGETEGAAPIREVAQPHNPAEANTGAAPVRAQPPAPTPTAMLRKSDTTNKPDDAPKPQSQRAGRLPPLKSAAAVGATCALLEGCTGGTTPQVRPTPAPVECPADWKASHKRLGIFSGGGGVVLQGYEGENTERAPLREGPVTVVAQDVGKLPRGTLLSGTLQLGESRFYGTFTRAQIPGGDAYPVCLVIGLEVPSAMPGGPDCPAGLGDCPAHESRPGNVKMFTRFDVFPKGSSYQGGFF